MLCFDSNITARITSQEIMEAKARTKDSRKAFKYNFICRLFFCWVDPLLWTGCRRSLVQSDLYTHPPECDSLYLHDKFSRYWSHELFTRGSDSARLWWVILKCFWWRALLLQFLALLLVAVLTAQSEVLGLTVDYYSIENPTSDETNLAYIYSSILILLSISLIFLNFVFYAGRKVAGMIRILLTNAIYSKVLRLSQMTLSHVTMGHVINIASNDVHRFDECFIFFPFFLTFPVHLCVVVYLLYLKFQWSSMVILIVLVSIPVMMGFSMLYSKLRFKAARMTDRRVKVMNEIISGIRVIKMYGWEYTFSQLIHIIRRHEVWFILASMLVRVESILFSFRIHTFIMPIVFSVFTLAGGQLTPGIVFSSFAHATFIRYSSAHFIAGLLFLFESRIGYKRIKNFLILPELLGVDKWDNDYGDFILGTPSKDYCDDTDTGITVENLTASWSIDINKLTLHDISFTVNKTGLLAVVGPVGSGKSTLLQCLLKELPVLSGVVSVRGSVAYASQEACVFSTTIRENILFGLPYDDEWYRSVVYACALEKDISLLENGDMTLVGERGVTLSGGQKARVNLARAVYRRADIYLLDDPLSAVDSAVSRHIFEKCVRGLLAEKSVVLVTHQTQYLEQCHSVLRLVEGISVSSLNDDIIESSEESQVELPSDSILLSLDQSEDIISGFDSHPEEERAHGTVSFRTYYEYFKTGGGYVFTLFVFGLLTLAEVNSFFADWWIADWSECSVQPDLNSTTCLFTTTERVLVYSGLTGSLFILTCVEGVLLCILFVRSSQVLHNRMFSHVLRTPIHFFDTNPIGRILNRFSKDIGFMDDILITKLVYFTMYFFLVLKFFLTAVIANYYLIVLLVILCVTFLIIRWYFLKTARNVKRLEAIARSPIYSHLSMTLQGLSTIRSYSMQSVMIKRMHQYQNQHTQAWYLFIVTSRWFSTRLDCLTVVFVTCATLTAVSLADSLDPGLLALSLTYAISLMDLFSFFMRVSTDVENFMVSPERVIAYGRLQVEASLETLPPQTQPPPSWPDKGNIVLNDVCYSHSRDGPQVLTNISCVISSREKVGIVGRTGAGKTSLVSALFRLAEPTGGSIVIDDINVGTIGLHDLRKNMSIIPQDPVLFGGSIHYNLDPFQVYSDTMIWRALEQVQLKSVVEGLDDGLLSIITEGGSNLSVGQRQLFCLARALLRNNPILILDEATANVDMKTDAIIQEVIREQFSECTVLTVAHRLNTVMDYDKIMVLDKGVLVEYDEPHVLLSQSSSYLGQLVDQTGPITARKLRDIAVMTYEKKKEV